MMNERILRNICVNDNDSGLNSIPNVPIRAVVRSTIVEAAEATINILEVVKSKAVNTVYLSKIEDNEVNVNDVVEYRDKQLDRHRDETYAVATGRT